MEAIDYSIPWSWSYRWSEPPEVSAGNQTREKAAHRQKKTPTSRLVKTDQPGFPIRQIPAHCFCGFCLSASFGPQTEVLYFDIIHLYLVNLVTSESGSLYPLSPGVPVFLAHLLSLANVKTQVVLGTFRRNNDFRSIVFSLKKKNCFWHSVFYIPGYLRTI